MTINITEDLSAMKTAYGINPQYQSHTAVSRQGDVFEGHIPAWLIQAFLKGTSVQPVGLTVGMPCSSPGLASFTKRPVYGRIGRLEIR